MVKESAEEVGVSDVAPEMVERVARAMCRAAMVDPDFCAPTLSARGDKPQWQHKVGLARAAIAAIREHQFGDMILVADGSPAVTLSGEAPTLIFRTLLDAALSPSTGQKQ